MEKNEQRSRFQRKILWKHLSKFKTQDSQDSINFVGLYNYYKVLIMLLTLLLTSFILSFIFIIN